MSFRFFSGVSRAGWRRYAFFLCFLIGGWLAYLALANALVWYCDKTVPRDPETNACIGAEERTLGPETATHAVLFVHGFVGGGNNFADAPEVLAERGFRVRVMRLPGHGTSPRDFAKVTPEELVNAVLAEYDALAAKYSEVSLVGHSMGGALCTLVAAQRPVAKLVLAAPYFGVTYRWYLVLPVEMWARLSAPLFPWLYKGEFFLQVNRANAKHHIFSYAWIPAQGARTLLEIGARASQPERLREVTCPVLWLHAPRDGAASFDAAKAAFDALHSETKETVSLPYSNHHIFWDYDSGTVVKETLRFLCES